MRDHMKLTIRYFPIHRRDTQSRLLLLNVKISKLNAIHESGDASFMSLANESEPRERYGCQYSAD
jgi:hypothetical protein